MEWLTRRPSGKAVQAEVVGKDRYGLSLGHIYTDDGWVNEDLVTARLAWHYVEYGWDIRLARAEQVAQSKVVGL